MFRLLAEFHIPGPNLFARYKWRGGDGGLQRFPFPGFLSQPRGSKVLVCRGSLGEPWIYQAPAAPAGGGRDGKVWSRKGGASFSRVDS